MGKHHDEDNKKREEKRLIQEKGETRERKLTSLILKLSASVAIFIIVILSVNGWASKPQESTTKTEIVPVEAVLSNGVQEVNLTWGKSNYYPEIIKVKSGIPVVITADTKRLTGCFQYIQIPKLGISKYVNGDDNKIEFTPQKPGTYTYSCYMGMGSGKVVVV